MAKLPNPIDQSVGGKVKAQRLRMGLSQEKLGEALGLTFQQVQKYEKGSNRISASKLQQIAQTLNVPPAFFFEAGGGGRMGGFAEEQAMMDRSTSMLATAEGLHLNRAFARIEDANVRRRIVDLVTALAGEPAAE